jgi:hypothetical protein
MIKNALIPISLICLVSGCAYGPTQIAKPTNITLGQAVDEVATTLHNLHDKYENKPKVGLIADSAEVKFEIAASATNTGGATLNLAAPLAVGNLSAGLSDTNVAQANRGNTITLEFKNIATADFSKGAYSLKGVKGPNPDFSYVFPGQNHLIGGVQKFDKIGKPVNANAKPGSVIITTPPGGLTVDEICKRTNACILNKPAATAN